MDVRRLSRDEPSGYSRCPLALDSKPRPVLDGSPARPAAHKADNADLVSLSNGEAGEPTGILKHSRGIGASPWKRRVLCSNPVLHIPKLIRGRNHMDNSTHNTVNDKSPAKNDVGGSVIPKSLVILHVVDPAVNRDDAMREERLKRLSANAAAQYSSSDAFWIIDDGSSEINWVLPRQPQDSEFGRAFAELREQGFLLAYDDINPSPNVDGETGTFILLEDPVSAIDDLDDYFECCSATRVSITYRDAC